MYSRIKQLNRFTDMIQIRPSQLSDLDRLMEIFDHARKFMASVGNGNQWINGYPQRELIAKEITDGHCYACEDEHGKIVGTFCFVPSPDPFYSIIEDGAWLNDDPYYVIHRIASDGSYKGIGDICLNWCTKQYPSLRADTHKDNIIMQKYWDQHSRFCPACGMPTEHKTPIMKKCPSCAYEIYPPISTAIIVLIRRGEEILLVHARNFRGTFYGLVAGFLEAGETLEQCVQREVMEETGLRVKNITYFGNQPWPYPSGLMVGFIADYESGEIKLQKDELSAGAFYSKENMPEIPRKLSIARKMIDWWLSNN